MFRAIIEFFKNLFKSNPEKLPDVTPVPVPETPINEPFEVPLEVRRVYAQMMQSGKFDKPRFVAEIDMAINSSKKRLFIYDTEMRKLYSHKVSHGSGGKNKNPHDGNAREFSNTPESHMSCLGLFKCAETYKSSKVGYALRLDGLSPTNSMARPRGIVIHGSDYVKDNSTGICGRSWGCPSIDWAHYKTTIDRLKGGSALFIHYNGQTKI